MTRTILALLSVGAIFAGTAAAAEDIPAGWSVDIKPKRAILTHMHVDLDYEELKQKLLPNIEPAYDGMVLITEG